MLHRLADVHPRRGSTRDVLRSQRKPSLNVRIIRGDGVNLGGVIIHSDTHFGEGGFLICRASAIATHTATSGDTKVETLQTFSMFEQTTQTGNAPSHLALGSFCQQGDLCLRAADGSPERRGCKASLTSFIWAQ